jgi:tetraacyldisaccharide 4'-kinase
MVEDFPFLDTVILDDAFQHRRITGHLNIVCTTFSKPFFEDQMMPMGRLRESISGIQRADALFVNRCPHDFNASEFTQKAIKFVPDSIPIFYTQIQYGEIVGPLPKKNKWHLIAGIADPLPFSEYVSSQFQVISERIFPDHHTFTEVELSELNVMAKQLPPDEGIITTHKDYMRLLDSFSTCPDLKSNLYYLPIEMSFVNQEKEFWAWLGNKMKR